MSKHQHPDWTAEGESVRVVRRSWTGRRDHEHVAVVARRTPTQVILVDGKRYKVIGGEYRLSPAYLDYITTLEPVAPATASQCTGCGAALVHEDGVGWVDALSGDDGGTYDKCPSGGPHKVEDL